MKRFLETLGKLGVAGVLFLVLLAGLFNLIFTFIFNPMAGLLLFVVILVMLYYLARG